MPKIRRKNEKNLKKKGGGISNSKDFDVLPVKRSNIFLDPEHSNIFCVIMLWKDYMYLDILYGI